jgi:glycosyltransferase involved in cell wall biosynthesis
MANFTVQGIVPKGTTSDGRTWICSQIGARQHYDFAVSLEKIGALDRLYTDAWTPDLFRARRYRNRLLRGFANRYNSSIPTEKVCAFTLRSASIQGLLGVFSLFNIKYDVFKYYTSFGSWFSRQVANDFSRHHISPDRHLYHGFTCGSLETLKFLKPQGISTILQQIDAGRCHYELADEERRRWPGWQEAAPSVPESYFRRIELEWEAASLVIVNSEWSRTSLIKQGVPESKLILIPLAIKASRQNLDEAVEKRGTSCADNQHSSLISNVKTDGQQKDVLQVLWAADVLLAKGIQYLIGAAKRLRSRKIIFLIAGKVGISREAVASAPKNVHFLGRVPRDKMLECYDSSDLLVLPTISDGFGLTQLEALSRGLPVITTPNCGAVVTDGVDGFIVPIRSEIAIADAIARLDDDRELLRRMAYAARSKAMQFSLNDYGELIVATVENALIRL